MTDSKSGLFYFSHNPDVFLKIIAIFILLGDIPQPQLNRMLKEMMIKLLNNI